MSTGIGKAEQTYKRDYDTTSVTVTLQNTRRPLTRHELEAAEALFRAAEVYSEAFYSDGTLRGEEIPDEQ